MSERLLLRDVKKGQIFYECEYGKNLKVTALEDARRVNSSTQDGYECLCDIGNNRDPVPYFQHIKYTHHLKIYKTPQYVEPNMLSRKYSTLAPVSSTLDWLLDSGEAEADLGEIEHKGEKVMVKIKVVRGE